MSDLSRRMTGMTWHGFLVRRSILAKAEACLGIQISDILRIEMLTTDD